MIKPREIMLVIILFSLLILIYFLTLNSVSELIKIPIDSIILFSTPFITLLSIIASAGVAIFVMKKNHHENIKIRELERKTQDELNIMRSERILNDYRMISEDYSKNIKTTYDLQIITLPKLIREIEYIINDCRKIREDDYYNVGDRQVELFELTDDLIWIAKNIEIALTIHKLQVQPTYISNKFLEMSRALEGFFKKSKYIS